MLKGKKLNTFVRFGGVNLKTQKGFGADSYHSPPASRGFYAMPLVTQEFFLISSMDKYQPGTMPKEPKRKVIGYWEDGEPKYETLPDEVYVEHEKRRKKSLSVKRKVFYRNTGNIWHHLGEYTDRNEIISQHGSWVKTSIKAWQKAFAKMSLNNRYGEKSKSEYGWDFSTNSINNPIRSGLMGMYSKDHCEVFFDEKV